VLLTYSKMREGVLLCRDSIRREQVEREGQTDLAIAHNIEQTNNVGSSTQVLQDLDLTLDLLLLDRLEDLDDAFLVVDDVDTLEDLRVLSAA